MGYGTQSPIGGIGAPSLASLSMSGLPLVLARSDARQSSDWAVVGEVIEQLCELALPSPLRPWLPLYWDHGIEMRAVL
jgi:hypothetical protein